MSYVQSPAATWAPRSARLSRRVSRLRRITGFVTVFDQDSDGRTALFTRFGHVQRVAAVAETLAETNRSLDTETVRRLVWTHDLNRWPFAHNSERERFDQIANLDRYFQHEDEVSDADVADLKGINLKNPGGISDEAKVVLLADAVTGMVEDPLFAVVGLNVSPQRIPGHVDELVGYSLASGRLLDTCRELTEEFHRPATTLADGFGKRVDELFHELVERFLKERCHADLWSSYGGLLDISQLVKESFMRKDIFPINNKLVCHADWLQSTVMPWYFANRTDASDRLLEIDEDAFVAEATAPGTPFHRDQFRPDLDVVSRVLPEYAFLR